MQDDKLLYEITDAEHPENNQVVDPDAPVKIELPPREMTEEEKAALKEEMFQRAAHIARIRLAEQINARRDKENARALVGRVAKRRRREKLAKASRKRNRG
jgi:hypothetical protein